MNKKIFPILLSAGILFTACSSATELETSASESALESTLESTEETEVYVHSDEDYFSLIDEGYATEVKTQVSGTCWATAASISMESAYLLRTGENISINPSEIVELVYGEGRDEGFFTPVNIYTFGGWAWEVIEATSNGIGDYILVDATDYTYYDRQTLQEAIRTYGGMNVAVNDMHPAYFSYFGDGRYLTLNDSQSEDFDHEVVIVAWDDNFPKEYFVRQPSIDGAWLAQNTKGEDYGVGGYYWISYETPLMENTIYILSDEYDHVLAYDCGQEDSISTGDTTTIANAFSEEGLLRGVGTYTTAPDTTIHIEILDEQRNVLHEQDAFYSIGGYHVVALDTPVEVSDYYISITFDTAAPVEGESWETSSVSYVATSNPGESFVIVDGEWIDVTDENISEILGIDFVPNNCCIKAIY